MFGLNMQAFQRGSRREQYRRVSRAVVGPRHQNIVIEIESSIFKRH